MLGKSYLWDIQKESMCRKIAVAQKKGVKEENLTFTGKMVALEKEPEISQGKQAD